MTQSSEKFCLKWNDFKENIVGSFKEMRSDTDFADVTLVSEEDQQIVAHKFILSACSPIFKSMFKRNHHSHPLIYMRGLQSKDLEAIVDFIYNGEANIFQDDLDGFLALAEELQLKGLTGSQSETLDEKVEPENKYEITKPTKRKNSKLELQPNASEMYTNESSDENSTNNWEVASVVPLVTGAMHLSGDITKEDLEARKMSMIERVEDGICSWRCRVCGKTTKQSQDIKRHTETHLEGVAYPCNQCGKFSRSGNALQVHVSTYHRK